MRLDLTTVSLTPRRAFRISRGTKTTVSNVLLRLSGGGHSGHGEASPNAVYGETADATAARLEGLRGWLEEMAAPNSSADIARIWEECWPALAPSRAAQCALDLALWDWLARSRGQSVAQLANGRPLPRIETFCTIGLCEPPELEERLSEVRGFPLLKIKSDARADLAHVRTIAERSGARIAVDANCAWSAEQVRTGGRELSKLPALFLEQPLPPARDAEMPALQEECALPLLADESCVTREDVVRLRGRFHGFNIKLVKCGGLTPALAMREQGRAMGLRLMTGCMLETGLLIAAGAVVAAGCDHADLDGAWLLSDDPCPGLRFDRGTISAPAAPGFGVTPRADLFPSI